LAVPLRTTDAAATQAALSKAKTFIWDRRTVQLVVLASVTTALLLITTLKNIICPPKAPDWQEQAELAAKRDAYQG